jgi:micrococcal nuclease
MNNIQRILLPALVLVLTLLVPVKSIAGEYQVTRVIDGDTIKVEGESKKITVRLVGIDAPETSKGKNDPGQPFSQRATKHLASLVLNKIVGVKSYGSDGYGRELGEVFIEDRNINLEMLKAGLAEVYRGKPAAGLDMGPYWEG